MKVTKEQLEPMFYSMIRSVEVLEKIQGRWRFLLPTNHDTWDSMNLDSQMQAHLGDDLKVMISIKEALPSHFTNHLPTEEEMNSQKERLCALVEYLASLSFALTHLLGIYTGSEKKTFWQRIKGWFGYS
jgi:hypothetical protein